jgi:aspartate kinase
LIVLKFGGCTISTKERIEHCLDLIENLLERKPLVVVSAHGKTTDMLIKAAESARAGRVISSPVRDYHHDLLDALGVAQSVIEPLLSKLEALLHGVYLLKELTDRTRDQVLSFGERLSSRTIAYTLANRGISAVPTNAYDIGFLTDSKFGRATPVPGSENLIKKKLSAIQGIPVVTGFIAKNADGDITTLGRSGTDYTATFLAAAIAAEEVIIYKDVNGVMTADPSIEKDARNIPSMSFEEASELAYFGAEVLHPATIMPAIKNNIPTRVVNAFAKDDPGTTILPQAVVTDSIAKSVVYKEDVSLFHIKSLRLHSVPATLNQALETLDQLGIVAHMIATSEAGISLITQSGLTEEQRKLAQEHLKAIGPSSCEHNMAIICLVGEELKGRPDSVAKIFTSLAQAKLNPKVITRSASEINLAFLVPDEKVKKAVTTLHTLLVRPA